MLILAIRTDNPMAEIYLYDSGECLAHEHWEAHRQLAETLHIKIKKLLIGIDKMWTDLEGVVCYKGPGSFTGLRIGLSVGNALAHSLQVPIITTNGDQWINRAIHMIKSGEGVSSAQPDYGREARVTTSKK